MSKSEKRIKSLHFGQMGFSQKPIVIDAHDHIVGRLGAFVAKMLLNGEDVVVVRCEDLILSGTFARNRVHYLNFLHKRCNVNPRRGPFHERAPSSIFKRAVRGMLPIKTKRGKSALGRLKALDGIPEEYVKVKRMMVPEAHRVLRFTPGEKYCLLGKLAFCVGWKYHDVVKMLEARRKISGTVYARQMRVEKRLMNKARRLANNLSPKMQVIEAKLRKYGCQ